MHQGFIVTHPDYKCCYVTYLQEVKKLNISFARLGEEECELCSRLAQEQHTNCDDGTCITCNKREEHKRHVAAARQQYKEDGESTQDDTVVRSVDLQKIIMLPRMPGIKSVAFTRRIVAFHETFASVGLYKHRDSCISVIWHEGMAGRKAEEITSTINMCLKQDRDFKTVIYYMDNCSSQNKNYSLFTSVLSLVNTDLIDAETVTFKYLEAGHTFMSADSVHHQVEKQMKERRNVYDWNDFKACVTAASKNQLVLEPQESDMKQYRGETSLTKLQRAGRVHLSDMRQIQFRRGQRTLFYKSSHNDSDWETFDYLKSKYKPDSTVEQIR
jgi:hypothetical protein